MTAALRGMTALYNVTMAILALPASPWLLYELLRVSRRRVGLRQRLGESPRGEGLVVWVHAVSVGEVRAILPMMRILKELIPEGRLFLSTTTVTGHETALRECAQADEIFYFPLDFPFAVRRSLDRVRPSMFVTAETELWPNFLAACFRRHVPVAVVNGRLSDRSYRNYRIFRWFFRPFLMKVSSFFVQSEEDARRMISIGARPESVKVTGNTKYDRLPGGLKLPGRVAAWAGSSPVIVAGSTHKGEEEALVRLVRLRSMEKRDVRLIIVPRHPERFEEVALTLETDNVKFSRFSRLDDREGNTGRVLLVDAMGLLDGFYNMADICFVGGSLVPVGGHNLLEPAMLGKPVLTGPYLHNFRDIADVLVEAGGARIVKDDESLYAAVDELLEDRELREMMGDAAMLASRKAGGASRKNAEGVFSNMGGPG